MICIIFLVAKSSITRYFVVSRSAQFSSLGVLTILSSTVGTIVLVIIAIVSIVCYALAVITTAAVVAISISVRPALASNVW